MQRRTLLKTAGGIAGTAAVGGLAIFGLSGSAAATGSVDYGDVTITSDDGTVEYVAIYGDSVVSWDGFDSTATQARIVTKARVGTGGGWTQLNDTGKFDLDNDNWGGANEELSGAGTSGTIETGVGLDSNGDHDPTTDWHVVGDDPDGYGLPQNSIDPAQLESDSDGNTRNFTIQVRNTYSWYDANGDEIFNKSWTSNVGVEVNNEPSSASASDGDGEDGAVGA